MTGSSEWKESLGRYQPYIHIHYFSVREQGLFILPCLPEKASLCLTSLNFALPSRHFLLGIWYLTAQTYRFFSSRLSNCSIPPRYLKQKQTLKLGTSRKPESLWTPQAISFFFPDVYCPPPGNLAWHHVMTLCFSYSNRDEAFQSLIHWKIYKKKTLWKLFSKFTLHLMFMVLCDHK